MNEVYERIILVCSEVEMLTGKVYEDLRYSAEQWGKPHVTMRPSLTIDGNQWCALYGKNLMEGVAGFGDSPAEAMIDFDRQWFTKLSERKSHDPD